MNPCQCWKPSVLPIQRMGKEGCRKAVITLSFTRLRILTLRCVNIRFLLCLHFGIRIIYRFTTIYPLTIAAIFFRYGYSYSDRSFIRTQKVAKIGNNGYFLRFYHMIRVSTKMTTDHNTQRLVLSVLYRHQVISLRIFLLFPTH